MCIQNLPVTLIFDRAGLVGKDGETHQGIFDMSFLSAMPNMTVIAPKSIKELVEAMKFAEQYNGPVAIRFARGTAYAANDEKNSNFEYGKSEIIKEGSDIALIAVGNMVEETEKAINKLAEENIFPTFVNARFVKPIDFDTIISLAKSHKSIIIVEEGIKRGGYGEGIEAFIAEQCLDTGVSVMAIEDTFVEQGSVDDLRKRIGISYENIYEKVIELVK